VTDLYAQIHEDFLSNMKDAVVSALAQVPKDEDLPPAAFSMHAEQYFKGADRTIVAVEPFGDFNVGNSRHKRVLVEKALGEMIQETSCLPVAAFVAMAWTVALSDNERALVEPELGEGLPAHSSDVPRPSEHPNRQEAVTITAMSRHGLTAMHGVANREEEYLRVLEWKRTDLDLERPVEQYGLIPHCLSKAIEYAPSVEDSPYWRSAS
jgi:hypothetical protein